MILIFILFLSVQTVWADDSFLPEDPEQSDDGGEQFASAPAPDAIEFPRWAQDLRRGEIIFFGSLPFTMLMSNIGYQGIDYLIEYSSDNTAVFGDITRDDQINILYITMGISLSIAITDYILGRFENE